MAHLRCAQGTESGSDKESAMRARRQQCGVPCSALAVRLPRGLQMYHWGQQPACPARALSVPHFHPRGVGRRPIQPSRYAGEGSEERGGCAVLPPAARTFRKRRLPILQPCSTRALWNWTRAGG